MNFFLNATSFNHIITLIRRYLFVTFDELIIIILSAVIFIILIYLGNGIPYGLDNNESFSSFNHARNFINYNFSLSMGLADETFSVDAGAHSFIHTHQGNFPRLFSILLYYVGFIKIEYHIILTSLLIGVSSMLLFFKFIKREFSCKIAFITIAFLLSDFYMFLQWQINTYRVWHMFFVAAIFYVVSIYKVTSNKKLLLLIFFISLFLFYGELLFAIFVSSASIIWFLLDKKNEFYKSFYLILAMAAGAMAACSIIIIQLISLLGTSGFIEDLRSSFLARNYANNVELLSSVNKFHMENHIVFFHNYVDGTQFKNIRFLIDAYFKYSLSNYSVPMALLFTIFVINMAFFYFITEKKLYNSMAILSSYPLFFTFLTSVLTLSNIEYSIANSILLLFFSSVCLSIDRYFSYGSSLFIIVKNLICFFLLNMHLSYEIFYTNNCFGFFLPEIIEKNHARAIMPIGIGVIISFLTIAFLKTRKITKFDLLNVVSSIYIGYIIFYFFVINLAIRLFQDPDYVLSYKFFSNKIYMFDSLSRIIIFLASTLGILSIILLKVNIINKNSILKSNFIFIKFLQLLGAAIISLGLCVLLLPGYAWSGYFSRSLSVLIPFIAVYVAVGMDWLFNILLILFNKNLIKSFGKLNYLSSSLMLFPLSIMYVWFSVQYDMYRLLFFDEFSNLLNLLNTMPNKSIVSNNYPAAYFLATKKWAYIGKPDIFEKKVIFEKDNLWLADYSTNFEYNDPDLYVCVSDKNPHLYMMREIYKVEKQEIPMSACENDLVIKNINSGALSKNYKIIASDSSGNGFWAVVLLK